MSGDLVELATRWAARLNEAEDEEDNRIGAVIDALLDRIEAQAAEIRSLREQVARARLEGAEIMREAAVDWLKAMDGYGEWWEAAQLIHDNLDPAAILEAHTRAKAIGTIGDSDGDDGA